MNIEKLKQSCLQGIDLVKKLFEQNKYDMVVLDEINISIRDGLVNESVVVDIIKSKPKKLELVLTGSTIGRKVYKSADLVTEMRKLKHTNDKKILARKGVEF